MKVKSHVTAEHLYFLPYLLQPCPEFAPQQVVQLQLNGLKRNNDLNDFGIAACFVFASPSNKMNTGPLVRFARMIRNPLYKPMLNHLSATFAPIIINGYHAQQRVTLISKDDDRASYLFSLSRQGLGPYLNCWMTDGVRRD
jgi:hypothetical protein